MLENLRIASIKDAQAGVQLFRDFQPNLKHLRDWFAAPDAEWCRQERALMER